MKNEQEVKITIPEKTVDNKLEMLQSLSKVESRLKKDINNDFTLAILDEKQKKGTIELVSTAYFTKNVLTLLADKEKKWEWEETKNRWKRRDLNQYEHNKILSIAARIFDAYMVRINMILVLNRNVKGNPLLRILAGLEEEMQHEPEPEINEKKMMEKVRKLVKPETTE